MVATIRAANKKTRVSRTGGNTTLPPQTLYGPLSASHLLVCLEDVVGGNRADSCAQRLDHSVCHFCAHTGGIGVQDTEVSLVTLHHQLQRAPLTVHTADVYCTLLTPPASTCKHKNISYTWLDLGNSRSFMHINPAVLTLTILLPEYKYTLI